VLVAIALSMAVGALLTFTSARLDFQAQEAFGGAMSVLAVGLVTWMIFWMRRTARSMKSALEHKVEAAIAMGTAALVLTAFVSVAREGVETALFLWGAVKWTNDGPWPVLSALAGLLLAAAGHPSAAAAAGLVAASFVASSAQAHGDPASDLLLVQHVFLPCDAAGLRIRRGGRRDPHARRALADLPAPGKGVSALASSAALAVQRLAAQEGVRISIPRVKAKGDGVTGDRIRILAAAAACLAVAEAFLFYRRLRGRRAAARPR
jgi:hypothetical protein